MVAKRKFPYRKSNPGRPTRSSHRLSYSSQWHYINTATAYRRKSERDLNLLRTLNYNPVALEKRCPQVSLASADINWSNQTLRCETGILKRQRMTLMSAKKSVVLSWACRSEPWGCVTTCSVRWRTRSTEDGNACPSTTLKSFLLHWWQSHMKNIIMQNTRGDVFLRHHTRHTFLRSATMSREYRLRIGIQCSRYLHLRSNRRLEKITQKGAS